MESNRDIHGFRERKSAEARAIRYLEGLVAVGKVGMQLESQTGLAAGAEVSLGTMSKAIAQLKSVGLLRCIPGHGTVILHRTRKASAQSGLGIFVQEKTFAWRLVANRIEADIFKGHLPRNRKLPSIKQLSATYGANPRTIRKALLECERHQSISAYGNGYRPAHHSIRESAHQILVFVYSETDSLELMYLDSGALRTIESLCRKEAATPRFIRYRFVEDSVRYVDHADGKLFTPCAADEILGALWLPLFSEHVTAEVCTHLLSLHKPISVKGITNMETFPASFRSSPRVRIFVGTSDTAMHAVRYLAEMRHLHIAYISAYQGTQWCDRRLADLTRVAREIPGVSLHTYLSPKQGSYENTNPDYHVATTRTMHDVAAGYPWIADEDRSDLGEFFAKRMHTAAMHSLYLWHLGRNLRPCIDQALHDASATGWIFGDDNEALLGWEYLRSLNIAVPGKISVVGVNNSLEAVRHSLTSCGDVFDISLHSMIDYVCYPATAPRGPVICLEGYVVERSTTTLAPW